MSVKHKFQTAVYNVARVTHHGPIMVMAFFATNLTGLNFISDAHNEMIDELKAAGKGKVAQSFDRDAGTSQADIYFNALSRDLDNVIITKTAVDDKVKNKVTSLKTEDIADFVAETTAPYEIDLAQFYGAYMQNEHISEDQFEIIKSRLIDAGMSLEESEHSDGVQIDLSNTNPSAFRECQLEYGVNDSGTALGNANGVKNCMEKATQLVSHDDVKATQKGTITLMVLWTLLSLGGSALVQSASVKRVRRGKPEHKTMNN